MGTTNNNNNNNCVENEPPVNLEITAYQENGSSSSKNNAKVSLPI